MRKKSLSTYMKFIPIIFSLILFTGCGSHMMAKTDLIAVDNQQAVVTFVRPSLFGGAIKFGIWDREKFIGILTANSLMQYKTSPGEHLFIAQAENWSYVRAELQAGKHYMIVGKVFPGLWKARVALDPVKKGDKDNKQVENWLAKVKPTAVISEKVFAYQEPRLVNIKKAIHDYNAGNVKFQIIEIEDNIQ